MLKVLLSPAKSLQTESECFLEPTVPLFEKQAQDVVNKLKKMTPKALSQLMSISEDLAQLNWSRFQNWRELEENPDAIQPIFAFSGEVYRGLNASSFDKGSIEYAQESIRILSGLYGILKPLDGISPYRLEMGSKFSPKAKQKNLYEYWGNQITDYMQKDLKQSDVIVNLASKEYTRVLDFKSIPNTVITPVFKDYKNGKLKTIMVYAKKARGSMAHYIVSNRIENLENLKGFNTDSYAFDSNLSSESEWVFIR